MRNIRAARRYARALFETARERGAIEPTLADLDAACIRLAECPEVASILGQPFFRDELKQKACDVAFTGVVSPLVLDFLHLLVSRDRGDLLEEVRDAYRALWHEFEETAIAQVTSAVALTAEETAGISGVLGVATGRRVTIEARVDPAILGGVIAVVGDQVWDGSVRGALERMRRELKSRDVVGALREGLLADAAAAEG